MPSVALKAPFNENLLSGVVEVHEAGSGRFGFLIKETDIAAGGEREAVYKGAMSSHINIKPGYGFCVLKN